MRPLALIVDDSLTVRGDLEEAFTAAGFGVLTRGDLAGAREALAGERVDLVVLDVNLPDGDGLDLLREVRGRDAERPVPVLLLSTEAEVRDRIRGLSTGANEFVGKPYDAGYVVARARELVGPLGPAEPAGGRTVLVVDDSTTFREALRDALAATGYQVSTAASGEDALRLAAELRPLAIVVDGVLPGVDGATVIRRVRLDAALRGTACLLLTGSDDGKAELHALDAGADAFVRKEEGTAVVLARLEALLRRPPAAAGAAASSVHGPKKVLAVDDSPTYLEAISDALRTRGHDVVQASSGEEALELLAVERFDCVLLDVLMPGLGGIETCRRIKAAPSVRETPVIMLTAREDRDALLQGLSAGADDYVPKSSDFEVLEARLVAQLRRRQFEDEHRHVREQLLRARLEQAEARAAREVAEARAALVGELERKNRELEAFSYSVSHDLRAPLRTIAGFSQALLEDYQTCLDEQGREHLRRVRTAATRMGELIEDLLELARVGRTELQRSRVDLTALARAIADDLTRGEGGRSIRFEVAEGLAAEADPRLTRVLLDNLLGNAWKFTSKAPAPAIELGVVEREGTRAFFVRDNGVGFDMSKAQRLFDPFQRLHTEPDFPGTGIGLATVQRIVERHGGRVWADAAPGRGATFYWTLPGATARAP